MEKIEIGTATLYHADAFEVLPTLTDGEVDNVISDMPFGVTACDWDVVPPLDQLWELMEAKAKATANFILFACGGFTFDLVNSKRSWYRYDLCWAKNNRTGFLNAALQPLRAHENILIFGRPGFQKTATYNAIKVPGGRPRVSRTRTRASGGVYPPQPPHTTISDGTTNPISVLAFNKDNNLPDWCAHPTQKPETLLGYLILMYSNPNDLIIDPFMGSCSTGRCGDEIRQTLHRNRKGKRILRHLVPKALGNSSTKNCSLPPIRTG